MGNGHLAGSIRHGLEEHGRWGKMQGPREEQNCKYVSSEKAELILWYVLGDVLE